MRFVGIIVVVIGVVLIAMGVNATDSIQSEFTEFWHGRPSEEAIWFLIGGGVLTAIGLGMSYRGPRE